MTRTLSTAKLLHAQHARNEFFVIVPSDTTIEEVLTPGYWANHVAALSTRPFARVEVVREDGTMDLDLRCIEVKPGLAKMRVIHKFVDDKNLPRLAEAAAESASGHDPVVAAQAEMPEGYKVGFIPNGPKRGFWVKLQSTGETLKDAIGDKGVAIKFANDHKRESEGALV